LNIAARNGLRFENDAWRGVACNALGAASGSPPKIEDEDEFEDD